MKLKHQFCAIFASLLLTGVAYSAQWEVSDSLTLGATYSDNLSLETEGDAGFILNASPSLNLEGKGGRATVDFSYSPSLIYYPSGVSNGDDVRLAHILDATTNTELYRQTLFLDASATANFSTVSTQGIISDSILNPNRNQVQTYTFKLSPYGTFRLNREAVLETRYSFGTVIYEGSQDDGKTHDVDIRVRKAIQTTPLTWSANADYSTGDTGNVDSSRYSLTGTLGYRFDARWSFSGTAGYENADVETSRSDTSGLTWNLGPRWTPNPRTNLSLQYGQSYIGSTWDVNFTHRSRRTELQITYSRGLTNARDFAGVPAPIGIGPIDGGGVNPINPSLTGEDFVSNRLSGELTAQGRRTTLSTSLDYTLRTYEVSGSKEWLVGIGLTGQRQLSSVLSLNANLYLQYIDPPGLGDTEVLTATAGVSRSVGRYSSLNLDFQHRQQDGDASVEYTENRASASFQTRFL